MQLLHGSIAKPIIVHLQKITNYETQRNDDHMRHNMAYVATATATTGSVFERVLTWFGVKAEDTVRRKVYRTTLAELQALSTRDLNDLGMSRSELKRVAWEAAYGPNAL